MSWSERLNKVNEKARETAFFGYSANTQKLYFKLQNAVDKRDAETTKKLIVAVSFFLSSNFYNMPIKSDRKN